MSALRPTRLRWAARAGLVATSLALAACGGGSDGGAAAEPGAARPSADATPGGGSTETGVAESIGGEAAGEALSSVGLEAKGRGLVAATGAERFEVVDGVLHLHLGDGARVPAGTECTIVGSVLTDGEHAVVHLPDGTEAAC